MTFLLKHGLNLTHEWIVRHPIKMGGMGLRSLKDTCYPAYIGALEQVAPYLSQIDGLQQIVGGQDCWGPDALSEGRWRVMLESGSKDGQELRQAWSSLQRQASQSNVYLGQEDEGILHVDVGSIGEGSTSGATRQKLIEELDKTHGLLINKALANFADQRCRPVWSWYQRD